MAGTATTPTPASGIPLNGGVGGSGFRTRILDPSQVNSFRISAVIDRLSLHGSSCPAVNEPFEFLNLCLSLSRILGCEEACGVYASDAVVVADAISTIGVVLSRGIDFAIANNEIPSRAKELPSLLKQVCQRQNDAELMAAVMVLMISVKNACQSGWFSDRDSVELKNLALEIASNFSSVPNFSVVPSCIPPVISTIMSRFYPRMTMGQMFVFCEAKPGFEAYVNDFQISKNLKSPAGEKIRLFVVQTDTIETSSCLVSPPKVSFLLNGKGVDRRTNFYMDTGPQMPSVVAHILKYGSNLLQAVGEFSGNYIIAVAFMGEVRSPDSTGLQDYEEHAPTTVDLDSELIEGPSRISLNCPISFRRIKTPVKGYSCKHHQCFDFDNYVNINSRKPFWRCPHCNQHVCFTDLRIDQKMAKILKEVGPNVSDIIISSDGSWSAAKENDDATEKQEDENPRFEKEDSPIHVVDLTKADDAMDVIAAHESEDTKLNITACGSEMLNQTTTGNPPMRNTNNAHQSGSQTEDEFWSGIYLSTFGVGTSNSQISGVPVSSSNYVASSALTESFNSALYGEFDAFHGNALVSSAATQNETSLANMLQLQQYQFGSPAVTAEYGRMPSLPRNVTRTPIAVQALPVQSPTSVLQPRSRNSSNTTIQNGFLAASEPSPVVPLMSNSTVRSNLFQTSQMSSSSLHQYSNMQIVSNFGQQQHRPVASVQPAQQNILRAPNHVSNAYRSSSESPRSGQQLSNFSRISQAMSQSPGLNQTPMQPSPLLMRSQSNVGVSQNRMSHPSVAVGGQQSHLIAAANRTAQMAFDSPRTGSSYSLNPVGRTMSSMGDQRANAAVASQPVARTDSHDQADRNWRPAGRMRGALSGQAYNDAFNQFIARPAQQAQAASARPIPNVNSPTGNVPPHLQPFTADRIAHRLGPNHPSAGSPTGPGNP